MQNILFPITYALFSCIIIYLSRRWSLSSSLNTKLEYENFGLKSEIEILNGRIKFLESVPPAKKVISVEAQQILHDMTAHGHSIVRITPISPGDVFWRSPS